MAGDCCLYTVIVLVERLANGWWMSPFCTKCLSCTIGKWLVTVAFLQRTSLLDNWQMAGKCVSFILIVLWVLLNTWAAQASLACCTRQWKSTMSADHVCPYSNVRQCALWHSGWSPPVCWTTHGSFRDVFRLTLHKEQVEKATARVVVWINLTTKYLYLQILSCPCRWWMFRATASLPRINWIETPGRIRLSPASSWAPSSSGRYTTALSSQTHCYIMVMSRLLHHNYVKLAASW